ncbi:MAG: tetratricopeptide repeat protein [Acidiferrobacterales bacterium]
MRLTKLIASLFVRGGQTLHMRTYKEGLAAYKSGHYSAAVASLRPYAKKGDALAQLTLGNMYKKGLGVPKDLDQAAHWYRKAATQGDPDAKFNLGIMYIRGDGVTGDKGQALNWLKDAAEQGHRQARLAYEYITRQEYQNVC